MLIPKSSLSFFLLLLYGAPTSAQNSSTYGLLKKGYIVEEFILAVSLFDDAVIFVKSVYYWSKVGHEDNRRKPLDFIKGVLIVVVNDNSMGFNLAELNFVISIDI